MRRPTQRAARVLARWGGAATVLAPLPAWGEAPLDVPALSDWGKVILVVALIAVGVIAMRRSGGPPDR